MRGGAPSLRPSGSLALSFFIHVSVSVLLWLDSSPIRRLEEAGLPVTLAEVRALFDVFDSNNDDSVSCKELISKLYPPPPRPGGARARWACQLFVEKTCRMWLQQAV